MINWQRLGKNIDKKRLETKLHPRVAKTSLRKTQVDNDDLNDSLEGIFD